MPLIPLMLIVVTRAYYDSSVPQRWGVHATWYNA
jgi:hypothetical protein